MSGGRASIPSRDHPHLVQRMATRSYTSGVVPEDLNADALSMVAHVERPGPMHGNTAVASLKKDIAQRAMESARLRVASEGAERAARDICARAESPERMQLAVDYPAMPSMPQLAAANTTGTRCSQPSGTPSANGENESSNAKQRTRLPQREPLVCGSGEKPH